LKRRSKKRGDHGKNKTNHVAPGHELQLEPKKKETNVLEGPKKKTFRFTQEGTGVNQKKGEKSFKKQSEKKVGDEWRNWKVKTKTILLNRGEKKMVWGGATTGFPVAMGATDDKEK